MTADTGPPSSAPTPGSTVSTTLGSLKVHVVQVAYGDEEPVVERVLRVAELVGQQRGADLVVLPELWAHGGFAFSSWAQRGEGLNGPSVTTMAAAAAEVGAVLHAGSFLERAPASADVEVRGPEGRGVWNTSVVFDAAGNVMRTYRKIHRFGFGEGERVLMEAGEALVTVPVPTREGLPGVTAGLATCYDLRFPELFRQLLDAGSDLFLVPAAWPAARVEHWTLLGRARAVENQSFVVQCNTAGTHSGVAMGGCSQVVSPQGVVLAQAGAGEEVLEVEMDLNDVAAYRESFPVHLDRRL